MTALTESTIRVGARDIFVASAGIGPDVVMLHGGGPGASGVANWHRNIDALAEYFTVHVPDMPGYGRSTKHIERDDPFGDLAASIRGLLDELEIESAHLVGNSYGGAAALRLALDRPERVDKMVLNGPGGIGTTKAPPTKGLNALLNYYGGSGPSREKMADFVRTYLVADPDSVPEDAIEGRYQDSLDPEVTENPPLRRPSGKHALRTLWRMDITRDPRLKKCDIPTFVMWGTEDKINRPSGAPALANTMPRADAFLASGIGHWVQWEAPELFNRMAIDFLTSEARR